jgi:hypothetical protein
MEATFGTAAGSSSCPCAALFVAFASIARLHHLQEYSTGTVPQMRGTGDDFNATSGWVLEIRLTNVQSWLPELMHDKTSFVTALHTAVQFQTEVVSCPF